MLDTSAVPGDILLLDDGSEVAVTRAGDAVYLSADRYPVRLSQGDVEKVRAALAFLFLRVCPVCGGKGDASGTYCTLCRGTGQRA